jgi:hypothetical protein
MGTSQFIAPNAMELYSLYREAAQFPLCKVLLQERSARVALPLVAARISNADSAALAGSIDQCECR